METRPSQKSKPHLGDFVWIFKKEETIRKGYNQSFTDEVFKTAGIPMLNPPSYSLIDSNKEVIQGKFYQPELQLLLESPDQKEM